MKRRFFFAAAVAVSGLLLAVPGLSQTDAGEEAASNPLAPFERLIGGQ